MTMTSHMTSQRIPDGSRRTTVLAFGGNALLDRRSSGSFDEQRANAEPMVRTVRELITSGDRLLLTHGNGPQVGNLALQQEEGAHLVAPQPLSALGAMTQGQIGHLLALGLQDDETPLDVTTVVSHVLVEEEDPAFTHPTKPIGPFFGEEEALRLAEERGWEVQDVGDGYRRIVPSPEPGRLLEESAVQALIASGRVVITAGGGGIPVVRRSDGGIEGVDAVIDKDLMAERLGTLVSADALALVTNVAEVALDYGTPDERRVEEMTVDEAEAHLKDQQFPAGSMGPKVTAAVRFLRAGGKVAVITDSEHVTEALAGRHGTRIVDAAADDRAVGQQ